MAAWRQLVHALLRAASLAVLLVAVMPLSAAARSGEVDYQRDPVVVFAIVTAFIAAAVTGLVLPFAWGRRDEQPTTARRPVPAPGDDLPSMPGGDIFESPAQD